MSDRRKIKIGRFTSLLYDGGFHNCKFSTFDNVQRCLNTDKKKTINSIKDCIQYEVTWFVTLNNVKYVDILKEEFEPIYIQKVPIGYNKGYQYHCLFMGGSITLNQYKRRIREQRGRDLLSDKTLNKIMKYKSKTWLKKFLEQFNYG